MREHAKNGGLVNAVWSHHARARSQQRGLQSTDIDVVTFFGTDGPAGRVVLLDKDVKQVVATCKRLVQQLERLRGTVVVCKEGTVVTCYRAGPRAGRQAFRDARPRSARRR